MKRSFGIVFMLLGLMLLLGAGALYLYNTEEGNQAQESVDRYLPQVMQVISRPTEIPSQTETTQEQEAQAETELPIDPDYYKTEMTVEMIDGYGFVGYLTIPSLNLQLPIMSETDDARLKLSPCRFFGSTRTDDLVIGGHNYWQHFGRLSELKEGQRVILTDMEGKQWTYEFVAMEVLEPNDVEELTKGEYALSLFTCTYGGGSRMTFRFDRVSE